MRTVRSTRLGGKGDHPSVRVVDAKAVHRMRRGGACTVRIRDLRLLPAVEGPALSGIDVLIAAGLNGRVNVTRAAGILAVGDCVGERIEALDRMGGCFWELDEAQLGDTPSEGSAGYHLREAWKILMDLDKVGVAIAHKTLHHKRPQWFPVLDAKTKVAYPRGRAWAGIHADLTRHTEQFGELEDWFANEMRGDGVHLQRLRLHDILLWCDRTDNRAID